MSRRWFQFTVKPLHSNNTSSHHTQDMIHQQAIDKFQQVFFPQNSGVPDELSQLIQYFILEDSRELRPLTSKHHKHTQGNHDSLLLFPAFITWLQMRMTVH